MLSTKSDPALLIKVTVKQASKRLSPSLNSLKLISNLGCTYATISAFIDGLNLDHTLTQNTPYTMPAQKTQTAPSPNTYIK